MEMETRFATQLININEPKLSHLLSLKISKLKWHISSQAPFGNQALVFQYSESGNSSVVVIYVLYVNFFILQFVYKIT